jgi:hypothetical protein
MIEANASPYSSTYIDPQSPIFNEPQSDIPPDPQYWLHCRQYVRELRACVGGCGRFVVVSRTRCHNVYMCDNCGSSRLRAWLWLSQRDLPSLKSEEQTGVEVTLPRVPGLANSESAIRVLIGKLVKQIDGEVSATGMAVVDPASDDVTFRFMLRGRHSWTALNKLWRGLTDNKGTLTLRHYSPKPETCYMQFLEWTFRGTSPLAQYSDEERLAVMHELKSSRRLVSFGSGDFYSPLPVAEQKSRREAQRQIKLARLCPCCQGPLDEIPRDDQETLTVEKMQEKHADKVIAYEEEYDPFWVPKGDVSRGVSRNIFKASITMDSQSSHAPPS